MIALTILGAPRDGRRSCVAHVSCSERLFDPARRAQLHLLIWSLSDCLHWTKVLLPIDKIHLYVGETVGKQKSYEITNG
jgi:hypothetical protein